MADDDLRSVLDQILHRRADQWRKDAEGLAEDEASPCLIRADECEEIARLLWNVKDA